MHQRDGADRPAGTHLGFDLGELLLGRDELLLQAPDTELAGLLPRLLPLLEADPSISLLDSAADLLSDPALVRPALVLAEEDALRDAVFATSLTEEGPLPFLARLQVGGTLDALLGTLELFFDLLEPA